MMRSVNLPHQNDVMDEFRDVTNEPFDLLVLVFQDQTQNVKELGCEEFIRGREPWQRLRHR